ncbi:MAG: putative quinol monooxygenase [Thermodesulfobacteriota bacterium]|jgi:quinol monooxygenase YgiN
MIHVIASLRIKDGKLGEFLQLFSTLAPTVRQEKGCYQYLLTADVEETGVPPQKLEKNVVTFIEKWESVDALQAHMQTPHMKAQAEKEKGVVEEMISLKILKEV